MECPYSISLCPCVHYENLHHGHVFPQEWKFALWLLTSTNLSNLSLNIFDIIISSFSPSATSKSRTVWGCSVCRTESNCGRMISHKACDVIYSANNPLPYVFLIKAYSEVFCPSKPVSVKIVKRSKDCICKPITFMKFIAYAALLIEQLGNPDVWVLSISAPTICITKLDLLFILHKTCLDFHKNWHLWTTVFKGVHLTCRG